MIHIFRKEMRKWHSILWIVAASMFLSGIGMIFLRQKNITEMEVASVNGSTITFNEFRRSFSKIQQQLNRMRPLAQAYGLSEEAFLQAFFGASRPEDIALDMCVKDELIDSIIKRYGIVIDKEVFKEELLKTLKAELPYVIDVSGDINMETYKRSLEQSNLTPAEYEQQKRESMKRQLVDRFAQLSSYIPQFVISDQTIAEYAKKSFNVVHFPLDHFITKAKKETVSNEALAQFYNDKKEKYRIGEKRKAIYWTLSPDSYEKNVSIDDQAIASFYNKNQSTLYRIPPKIKVRHILVKEQEEAAKIYDQVIQKPQSFAELAKKYSRDEATAKNGGLTDLFSRGSYEEAFEKAAFRLKEPNAIAPVVKVKDGFEIIQLVTREHAETKPLDVVRDEIEKTLRVKKAQQALRSDLEFVVRGMRSNENAIDEFVKNNDLKKVESAFLAEHDNVPGSIEMLLASRLFSSKKSDAHYGYFTHKKQAVLYKLSDVEKSYIPSLDQVKNEVTEAYYKKQAKNALKKELAEAKLALLDQKMTPDEISKQYSLPLISTGKFTKSQKPKELRETGGLKEQLAQLSDAAQVLQYKHAKDYYLAQINEIDRSSDDKAQGLNIIKKEKYKDEQLQLTAFIASLQRNAKIEVDRKMLGGRQANQP